MRVRVADQERRLRRDVEHPQREPGIGPHRAGSRGEQHRQAVRGSPRPHLDLTPQVAALQAGRLVRWQPFGFADEGRGSVRIASMPSGVSGRRQPAGPGRCVLAEFGRAF